MRANIEIPDLSK
jgi:D-amino-acid oxidase